MPPHDPGRPPITLTTDFGTADGYVGAMKGRLASLAPGAALIDVSHEIAPQNVIQGAWCLRRAVPAYPPGTVHLAVVDPGVGSARRGIVLETVRFLLVGPDNGLLEPAARRDGIRRAFAIDERAEGWAKSGTFDGLTLFAPVAAHLWRGEPPGSVGPAIETWQGLEDAEPERLLDGLQGAILFFDRFGNAITNVTRDHVAGCRVRAIGCGDRTLPHVDHYGALTEAGAVWNSDGHLELAVFGGSAREALALTAGQMVRVWLDAAK